MLETADVRLGGVEQRVGGVEERIGVFSLTAVVGMTAGLAGIIVALLIGLG